MKHVLLVLCTVIIFCAVWRPALSVTFLSDDYQWFHTFEKSNGKWWEIFIQKNLPIRLERYRPLGGISLYANFLFSKYDPFFYHATNIFLHAAISILVGIFAARLIRNTDSMFVGFITAVLFAVHPFTTQAVIWISGRYDLLASFFILIALSSFHFSLNNQSKTAQKIFFIVGIIATIFSLLSKEISYVMPLYFLAMAYFEKKLHLVRNQLLILTLTSLGFVLASNYLLGEPIWRSAGYVQNISVSRVFLVWVSISCFGIFLRKYLNSEKKTSFWRGNACLRRQDLDRILKSPILSWLFLGISLLPTALFPTEMRFLYLPTIFATLFFVSALHELFKKRLEVFFLCAVILILMSGGITLNKARHWKSASQTVTNAVNELCLYAKNYPQLFITNLPDSDGEIPLFRTYVQEAVSVCNPQTKIIVGPTTIRPGKNTACFEENKTITANSESGYVIFAPTITDSNENEITIHLAQNISATFSSTVKHAQIINIVPKNAQFTYENGSIRTIQPCRQ